jgi:hypothetical protein
MVEPVATATARVDVIEACGNEQVGGMDLPGLPVRVVRELVRVDLREEPKHGWGDRSCAAVAARPTVADVNRNLDGDGRGPASRDLDSSLPDGGKNLAGPRVVAGQRGRDERAKGARELLSGG